MSQGHHLAAILFTDIEGYTALMQEDETKALAAVRRHNHAIEEHSKTYGGEVANFYGDGCLVIFPSATEAVQCAIDIQKDLQKIPAVPLRIGIHMGEIFYEGGKVIGDGVNLASRVQSLGIANSILISADIQSQIKNQPELKAVSLGSFHFKNVKTPKEVYALTNYGLAVPLPGNITGKLQESDDNLGKLGKKLMSRMAIILTAIVSVSLWFGIRYLIPSSKLPNSIIVLPFSTPDSSQNYFAAGITIDVVTELAKVKNLSTKSWNTSFSYANTKMTLKEVADETNVSYVLEGSIQKYNRNIRVNINLVNPEDNNSLWAASWDETVESIFDIQKQIAKEVASELGIQLSLEENSKLNQFATRNVKAYDLFLKARTSSLRMADGPAALKRSNQLLDEALKLDPDFPQALTLRANNNVDLTWMEGLDPVLQMEKVNADLKISLNLNPEYSDTYMVMGIVNYIFEWNMPEAKKNFDRGWALSNYGEAPITQCFCGIVEFNMITGDYQRALSIIDKVEEIDPEYPFGDNQRMMIYSNLHDSMAIRNLLRTLPESDVSYSFGQYYLGNYDAAVKSFASLPMFMFPDIEGKLASSYFRLGMIHKSDSIVNLLIEKTKREKNVEFYLAVALAARGEKASALKWYQAAFEKRDLWIVYSTVLPDLEPIINEPEVRNILKEIGI